jgi:hypothetical protein
MAHRSKRMLALSEHLYRLLLVVYPTTFRRQFGSQMTQVFLDCCRAVFEEGGSWGVVRFWLPTLVDLGTNAIAEHISTLIQRLRTRTVLFNVHGWPAGKGRGGNMLHITNGDRVGETLRQTGLPGDILAEFMRRDRMLAQCAAHKEVILWFEHDLYDQLQLIQILDWFSHHDRGKTALSLICIHTFAGIAKFVGLGQLNAGQLGSLFQTRRPLTQVELTLGSEAWNAYCSPDPEALEAFLSQDTSALPFLKAALLRHLEQFPALQGGLSRTEREILEVVASGVHKPLAIFRTTHEKEESPFMGDSALWLYLSTLRKGQKPFLRRTDGGAFAFPTIDRWLGGVHLQGRDAAWRWDTQRETLVQVPGTA